MPRIARVPSAIILPFCLTMLAIACGGSESDSAGSPTAQLSPTAAPSARTAQPADNVVDLAAERPLSLILGADTGDYANDLPALATGDVNGDGLDDLLIGARFGDGPNNTRTDGGEAYIILGRASLRETIDLANGEADVTIYGAQGQGTISQQGDQLGFSGALGDVNGDGLDDIVLGAPMTGRQDVHALAGAAHVVFGRPDMPKVVDLAAAAADLTLIGAHSNSLFGDAVTTGDIDGDGAAEVIVGAPFEPRPVDRPNAGQLGGAVFVFRGGTSATGTRDIATGGFDAVVYGAEEFQGGDEAGDAVATGDLNDDSLADIVITAEAADGPNNERSVAAEVYVVYGSEDFMGRVTDVANGDQDVTVYGADANDTTGFNVGAGDVTGDGVDDMLVSLRGGDGEGNRTPEAGELHIFPGGSLPEVVDLSDDNGDIYVYGTDAADFLGNGLAVTDWDGDGASNLVIGSPLGDGPGANTTDSQDSGEVFIVDARGLSGGTRVSEAAVHLTVFGAKAEDGLGQAVAAGDLNGDGNPELAILAMRADRPDGSAVDAGVIYILSSAR